MHKTCCNNRPRKRVDMNLMARRPRVPLTNPYLISLSKQEQLCPRRGHKTHFARTLNPDAVYEVCDDCGYFFTLVAPEWAWVKDAPKPVGKPKSSPRFIAIEGGLVRLKPAAANLHSAPLSFRRRRRMHGFRSI